MSTGDSPPLHGVQLWVALPDAERDVLPAFDHHADLPVASFDGSASAVVLIGSFAGVTSPARAYSPIGGAEITVSDFVELPLRPDFEYALLRLDGSVTASGVPVPPDGMLHLGDGFSAVAVQGHGRLLLGGEPLEEELVMWWNFVGRSHEEIAAARDEWTAGAARFGPVAGPEGTPLPAPALPGARLRSRPRAPR